MPCFHGFGEVRKTGALRRFYAFAAFAHRDFTLRKRISCGELSQENAMFSDILFLVGGFAVFALAAFAVRAADRL